MSLLGKKLKTKFNMDTQFINVKPLGERTLDLWNLGVRLLPLNEGTIQESTQG